MKKSTSFSIGLLLCLAVVLSVAIPFFVSASKKYGTPLPFISGAPIRGYDLTGKLRVIVHMRSDGDSLPSINSCRDQIEKLGGGVCVVQAHTIQLLRGNLTRAPYQKTLIAVEGK